MPGDAYDRYTDNFELIELILGSVGRQKAFEQDEAEDFASWARIRLLEGDCAILRKFKGRSSFSTFLTTVINNLFRDYRISKWGKWRPSARATRMGAVAIRLEQLIYRDELGYEHAVETLRQEDPRTPVEEIERLFCQLPPRTSRQTELAHRTTTQTPAAESEKAIESSDLERLSRKAQDALNAALAAMPPKDRLILKLRFGQECRVVDIARILDVEPAKLYPRIQRLLGTIRNGLEDEDLGLEAIGGLLTWIDFDLRIDYESPTGREAPP